MNDFEIQRGLRGMNAPRAPQADLWPAIAQRIADEGRPIPLPVRRRRWLPFAAAASLLVMLGGSLVLHHMSPAENATGIATLDRMAFGRVSPGDRDLAQRAPGGDPRLAGAAVVLDAAQVELRQAIAQNPNAPFLVDMLNRTHARRSELDRFGTNAG